MLTFCDIAVLRTVLNSLLSKFLNASAHFKLQELQNQFYLLLQS